MWSAVANYLLASVLLPKIRSYFCPGYKEWPAVPTISHMRLNSREMCLYRARVTTETAVPFKKLKGAVPRIMRVLRSVMLGLTLVPMPTMAAIG